MRMDFKKSLRIWVFPVAIYYLMSVLVLFLFLSVTKNFPRDSFALDRAEELLVLILGSFLLIAAYIVGKRYERINNSRISKRTLIYGKIFLSVYLIYLAIIVFEWLGRITK